MDKLWAPWRSGYVRKILTTGSKCFFCEYVRSREDKKNYVLERSKHSFSVLNLYPYNNGHLMVVPNRHVSDLAQLKPREREDLMDLFIKTKKLCGKIMKPHGFNAGINFGRAGGAGVADHLHIHLIPRWFGDTNFMPVLAQTKVISESLQDLYARLTGNSKKKP